MPNKIWKAYLQIDRPSISEILGEKKYLNSPHIVYG